MSTLLYVSAHSKTQANTFTSFVKTIRNCSCLSRGCNPFSITPRRDKTSIPGGVQLLTLITDHQIRTVGGGGKRGVRLSTRTTQKEQDRQNRRKSINSVLNTYTCTYKKNKKVSISNYNNQSKLGGTYAQEVGKCLVSNDD